MTNDTRDLLKALSEAVGVSGYEGDIRALLREQCAPYVDEFSEDLMGSLLMLKRGQAEGDGPRRKIMLSAHTDEVGAMVTSLDRGFISFTGVGGLDPRQLMGQQVQVLAHSGQIFEGVVASRPPHFSTDDRSKFPRTTEFQIDLGLPPHVVSQHIRVGDIIAYKKSFIALKGDLVSGKALDDRASVAAVYVCLRELSRLRHDWDVYGLASSQEEVGLKGAKTSAYRLQPDIAIAIDVTFADAPGLASGHDCELGKGPVLTRGANIHPVMADRLKSVAEEQEIPLQNELEPAATGTDAWAIQTAHDGIPTALLGVPLRYMHSPIETASLKDIERTGRLMAYFIAQLSEAFIDDLRPKEGLED